MTPPANGSPISRDDGLRARDNGGWARDKLAFLDDYGPTALDATLIKRERVYIDLFAGPGRNVERGTGEEFEGSPLRVLQMQGRTAARPRFTAAHFVNLDPEDHAALATRVDRLYAAGRGLVPRAHVHVHRGDANHEAPKLIATAHEKAYVFVFADITKPSHWPWRTVERIAALPHGSVELYLLFPLGMAIKRLIGFQNSEHTEKCAASLTRFFGTDEWRPLVAQRVTEHQSGELGRGLEALYLAQLRRHWKYARAVKDVRYADRKTVGGSLYRMLFASNHQAGEKIAEWAKNQVQGGQQMGLGF